MKTNRSHVILLLLIVIGCLSCSKENEEMEVTKTYRFSSLQWRLEEGDGQEILAVQLPEQTYLNEGSTPIKVEIDRLKGINFFSFFKTDQMEKLNKWTGNDVTVSVPSEFSLLSSQYSYFTGEVTAPLIAGKEFPIQTGTTITEGTNLQPGTKMTYKATIYLKKITASYLATFVIEGKNPDYAEVRGKWSGEFFDHTNAEIKFDNIQ